MKKILLPGIFLLTIVITGCSLPLIFEKNVPLGVENFFIKGLTLDTDTMEFKFKKEPPSGYVTWWLIFGIHNRSDYKVSINLNELILLRNGKPYSPIDSNKREWRLEMGPHMRNVEVALVYFLPKDEIPDTIVISRYTKIKIPEKK